MHAAPPRVIERALGVAALVRRGRVGARAIAPRWRRRARGAKEQGARVRPATRAAARRRAAGCAQRAECARRVCARRRHVACDTRWRRRDWAADNRRVLAAARRVAARGRERRRARARAGRGLAGHVRVGLLQCERPWRGRARRGALRGRRSEAFFALPKEHKTRVKRQADNSRGWFDDELTKQKLDWKECFDFGAQDGHLDGTRMWMGTTSGRPSPISASHAKSTTRRPSRWPPTTGGRGSALTRPGRGLL